MNKYKHLSLEEREVIKIGIELGKSYRTIANELGRNHTTVSREIKRNQIKRNPSKLISGEYIACRSHAKAQKRASEQRRKAPLKCPFVFIYVREKLRARWSPEEIAGRLNEEYPEYSIHHETIYRYIYSKPVKNRYKLWKYLPLRRTKRREQTGRSVRRLKGKIPEAISIEQRPELVEQRSELGHCESDLMLGPQSSKSALSATVERKTRFTILSKVKNHTAIEKTDALRDGLYRFPPNFIQSLTVDNGKENTQHKLWSQYFDAPVYFCHAYHSWEKGTVENTIGRIRRFIPKGTNLSNISQAQIQLIEDWLNHTPRKCLNWMTPYEVLQAEINAAR